jgi:hypothetical protein
MSTVLRTSSTDSAAGVSDTVDVARRWPCAGGTSICMQPTPFRRSGLTRAPAPARCCLQARPLAGRGAGEHAPQLMAWNQPHPERL